MFSISTDGIVIKLMGSVVHNPITPISFFFINPHMACQYLDGIIFPSLSCIVAKEGSNTTWNCGDALLVIRISTNDNLLAWIGDTPKYIPGFLLSLYLSNG